MRAPYAIEGIVTQAIDIYANLIFTRISDARALEP